MSIVLMIFKFLTNIFIYDIMFNDNGLLYSLTNTALNNKKKDFDIK